MEGTATTVLRFSFSVHGRTRDECISLADELGRDFMDRIGGEPWLMVDDDWRRQHVSRAGGPLTVADDQGFFYQGMRTYVFQGPFVPKLTEPLHDGYNVQKHVRED